jgi:hypothetical protein
LSTLPDILGAAAGPLPAPPAPVPDPAHVSGWAEALARRLPEGRRRIGLAWRGSDLAAGVEGPGHGPATVRAWPLAAARPLAEVEDVAMLALEPPGAGLEQVTACGFRVFGAGNDKQVDDLAAAILACDLVVTLDSFVAHLAGSLGVRTWLALPFSCDWRWGLTSESTPWYPSMRLFRQVRPGDWSTVFAEMAAELRGLVACRPS